MFDLYDTVGNVYELISEHVKDFNNRAMKLDLAVLREQANDETLGTTPENPVIDYFGQNDVGNCWRTLGGSYQKKSNFSIWSNDGWYMQQLYGTGSSHTGVRVSMTVE
jgi:hypothetical protein